MRKLLYLSITFDLPDPVAADTLKADLYKNAPVVVQANTIFQTLIAHYFKINQSTIIVDVVNFLPGRKLIKYFTVHTTNKLNTP